MNAVKILKTSNKYYQKLSQKVASKWLFILLCDLSSDLIVMQCCYPDLIKTCFTIDHVGICPEGKAQLHTLHEYVKKVVFYSEESQHTVQFDVLGNGKAKYRVLRFAETAKGWYRYGKVCIENKKKEHITNNVGFTENEYFPGQRDYVGKCRM